MRLHTHQLFGFLSAIIAATTIVTSCSAPDESAGDAARVPAPEPGAIPVTVQQAYAPAVVDRAPTRIAAMGVWDGDTLLALGVIPTTIAVRRSGPGEGAVECRAHRRHVAGGAVQRVLGVRRRDPQGAGHESGPRHRGRRRSDPRPVRPARQDRADDPAPRPVPAVAGAVGRPDDPDRHRDRTTGRGATQGRGDRGLPRRRPGTEPCSRRQDGRGGDRRPDRRRVGVRTRDGRAQAVAGYGLRFPPALEASSAASTGNFLPRASIGSTPRTW